MQSASFAPRSRRKGVSEVLGALLLIVVVIAAVASLSVFLGQTEKNAEQRSALLISVQDENLQVAYSQFSPSSSSVQWELDINPHGANLWENYYIQSVQAGSDPNTVQLIQMDSNCPVITANLVGSILLMHKGESAALATSGGTLPQPPTCTPAGPYTLTFGSAGYLVNPARWSNVTISVRNLNTEESGLSQVAVNDNWLSAWEEVSQTGLVLNPPVTGSPNGLAIIIPARATFSFNLSLLSAPHPVSITKNQSMEVTLLTSAGNYFYGYYSEPTAVVRSSTSSQNLQVVTRDVVTFDGSQSFSSESSIASYVWRIEVPNSLSDCTDSAFSNPSELDVAYVTGETVQYLPESMFTPAELSGDCVTGPIQATLFVTDDNGFIAVSQPLLVGPDPNIAPAASMTAAPTDNTGTSGTVVVTVDNILGYGYNGAVVTAIVTAGDVVLTSHAEEATSTNSGLSGTAIFTFSWTTGGSVEFETGTLPPVSVTFASTTTTTSSSTSSSSTTTTTTTSSTSSTSG